MKDITLLTEREAYIYEAAVLAIIHSSNTEESAYIHMPTVREQKPLQEAFHETRNL